MKKLWTILLLTSCSTPGNLVPATGPNTEYPCGINGVICPTSKTCCNEEETCGGEPHSVGCPTGECCFIGPDNKKFGDGGTPVPRLQTKQFISN